MDRLVPLSASIYFASPWMLLALSGVLIPILIHLWRRRPQREIEWGAMRFLELAMQSRRQRAKFEQFLLLLIRCTVLGCVGLAVAQPFRPSSDGLFQTIEATPPQLLLLVVDDSYSTLAPLSTAKTGSPSVATAETSERSTPSTVLDQIRHAAIEHVRELHAQDAVAILRMSEVDSIVPITFDHDAALLALRELKVSERTPVTHAWISCLEQTLKQGLQRSAQIQRVEVVLLSDMASNVWNANAVQKLTSVLQESSVPIHYTLSRHTPPQYSNLWVEDLSLSGSAILGTTAILRARIDGYLPEITRSDKKLDNINVENPPRSANDRQQMLEVTWSVDQQVVASQTVRVEQLPMVVEQAWQPTREGPHAIECRIAVKTQASQELPTDNACRLVVIARPATRILMVEGWKDSAKYVSAAFEVGSIPIEIRRIPNRTLRTQDFSDIDLVFLSDAPLVDEASMQCLYSFVTKGGGAIVACGAEIPSQKLQRTMESVSASMSRLPFQILQSVSGESLAIDPLDYRSSLIAPFRDFPESGLLSTPIARYWKAQVDSSHCVVDLALANQDPLIFHHEAGQGLFYWILTPLTLPTPFDTNQDRPPINPSADVESWNAIAAWPSFVPLMQGMLGELTNRGAKGRTVVVGQSIGGSLASTNQALNPATLASSPKTSPATDGSEASSREGESPRITSLTLETPSLAKKIRGLDRSVPPRWFLEMTEEQGFYRARQEQVGYEEWFGVNVDTRESRQSYVESSVLPQEWQDKSQASPLGNATSQDQPASRWLLVATFVGLLAETSYLAWLSRGRPS